MKHNLNISIILLLLFLISQLTGLFILSSYIDIDASKAGEMVFYPILIAGVQLDRPDINENASFIYIMGAILVGTALAFVLIFFKVWRLWRFWFFLAVSLALAIALSPLIAVLTPFLDSSMISVVSCVAAVILAFFKVFRQNVFVHNITELFIYGGIAVIFVPVMSLFSAFSLLVFVSIYDAWAVWKSKHMVALAEAQSKSKVFAGLFIPYELPKKIPKGAKVVRKVVKNAVLGGGDIGFCLLFAGVVMKSDGLMQALIVSVFATVALGFLLWLSKKDKFYPAMPFLTTGCLVGWLVSLLI